MHKTYANVLKIFFSTTTDAIKALINEGLQAVTGHTQQITLCVAG
jgi:hypothetical protein